MFIDSIVKQYIRDQWVNYRRALNDPQAREEILSFATLSVYLPGSTTPKQVFADEEHGKFWCNPVMANEHGEFPVVHLDFSDGLGCKIELKDRKGMIIASVEAEEGFEV